MRRPAAALRAPCPVPRRRSLAPLVLVTLTLGCSLADGEYFGKIPEPDPRHFRWCNNSEPEFVDPALSTSTTDIKLVYPQFAGLTQHDAEGLPIPDLAESWEISPDQRTFKFTLRPGLVWSNGRPFTSADFIYHVSRVAHPLTASARAESTWYIKHAKAYNEGVARVLLRDAGPFKAGELVKVLPEKGPDGKETIPPDSDERRTRGPRKLHAEPRADSEAYATIPGQEIVTIVELSPARDWAYVYWPLNGGVYGWAPLADLDEPHAERDYQVESLTDAEGARRRGTVKGRDILMLPEILGIEAPDARTLVFHTEGPTPFFLDLTLQGAYRPSPREVVSRWPKTWFRPGRIVTSGPFHMTFWREKDRFELVKSPSYWAADRVKLDKVTFYSVNDQSAAVAIYYQGGCDATVSNNIPNSYLPVLNGETKGQGGVKKKDYIRAAYLGIYFYILNTEKLPNVHLRRALNHSLDRTKLTDLIKGGQIPVYSYTPGKLIKDMSDEELALCGVTRDTPGVATIVEKGKLCYVPPLGPTFDLAKAKAELELAKKEMGDAFPKKISVKFNTGVEQHKHIAEWVQEEWKVHLGLQVELESQEWKVYLNDTRVGEFMVGRMGAIGNLPDPEAEFLANYRCDSPDNRPRWCNRRFDELYREAEKEANRGRRLELMREAERLMMDESPIIPLYVYTQHHLQKPYVKGLSVNLTDQPNLADVWLDPDWKKNQAASSAAPPEVK